MKFIDRVESIPRPQRKPYWKGLYADYPLVFEDSLDELFDNDKLVNIIVNRYFGESEDECLLDSLIRLDALILNRKCRKAFQAPKPRNP